MDNPNPKELDKITEKWYKFFNSVYEYEPHAAPAMFYFIDSFYASLMERIFRDNQGMSEAEIFPIIKVAIVELTDKMIQFGMYLERKTDIKYPSLTKCSCISLTDEDCRRLLDG